MLLVKFEDSLFFIFYKLYCLLLQSALAKPAQVPSKYALADKLPSWESAAWLWLFMLLL